MLHSFSTTNFHQNRRIMESRIIKKTFLNSISMLELFYEIRLSSVFVLLVTVSTSWCSTSWPRRGRIVTIHASNDMHRIPFSIDLLKQTVAERDRVP